MVYTSLSNPSSIIGQNSMAHEKINFTKVSLLLGSQGWNPWERKMEDEILAKRLQEMEFSEQRRREEEQKRQDEEYARFKESFTRLLW